MNKKKIDVYEKQLKSTKFLHMMCEDKKQVVNINDIFAYNGELFETPITNSKFELKKSFDHINNYVSNTTNNCGVNVLAFVSGSERFNLKSSKLVGVFNNGNEINALDDLAENIIKDTFSKKGKMIGDDDIFVLQESYIFLNNLKRGTY